MPVEGIPGKPKMFPYKFLTNACGFVANQRIGISDDHFAVMLTDKVIIAVSFSFGFV